MIIIIIMIILLILIIMVKPSKIRNLSTEIGRTLRPGLSGGSKEGGVLSLYIYIYICVESMYIYIYI